MSFGSQGAMNPENNEQQSGAPLKAHLENLLERYGKSDILAQHLTSSIKIETVRIVDPNPFDLTIVRPIQQESQQVQVVLKDDQFGLRPSPATLSFEPDALGTQSIPNVDFSLLEILGEGGMGKVFLGNQSSLGREVALKVSKADPHDPYQLAQTYHEAQITATLDHPNILPLYLLAQDEQGRPIQVMKRIKGTTWADLIADPSHALWSELLTEEGHLHVHLEILAQVAQAITYAHERGIIHRDLKPENVMIGRFGEVYVLDWGVALSLNDLKAPPEKRMFIAQERCKLETLLVGTPVYMPPEMGRRDHTQLSTGTDVYLLGAILYEILCGHPIRTGHDIHHIFDQIIAGLEPEIPSHLSEEFQTLLQVSLCSDPSQRLSDAQNFRRLLIHATKTDRANQVRQRAEQSKRKLEHMIFDSKIQVHEELVFDLYDEARLDYRSCLEMWPTFAQARQGLDQLHTLFCTYLIAKNDLDAARRTFAKLSQENPELLHDLEEAEQRRDAQVADHAKLKNWHQHHDIKRSRSLRVIVTTVGLIVFGFGAVTIEILQALGRITITPRDEFKVSLGLSIVAFSIIGIFAFQRRHIFREANAMFGRFVGFLVLITMIGTLQRYVGGYIGLSSPHILLQEMSLIALGSFGLSAIGGQKSFLLGGVSSLIGIMISVYHPDVIKMAYAVSMVTVWLSALVWTKQERKLI